MGTCCTSGWHGVCAQGPRLTSVGTWPWGHFGCLIDLETEARSHDHLSQAKLKFTQGVHSRIQRQVLRAETTKDHLGVTTRAVTVT